MTPRKIHNVWKMVREEGGVEAYITFFTLLTLTILPIVLGVGVLVKLFEEGCLTW